MTIRVGIGGWTYEPWRRVFYPEGLPHKRELEFASQQLTTIEINFTFYGLRRSDSADPQAVAMTAGNSRIPLVTSLSDLRGEALW